MNALYVNSTHLQAPRFHLHFSLFPILEKYMDAKIPIQHKISFQQSKLLTSSKYNFFVGKLKILVINSNF